MPTTTPTAGQRAAVLAVLTVLLALFGILTATTPADAAPAKVTTYTAVGETSVSAKEHGALNVYCNPGDQPKSWKVTTKAHYSAYRFQFTNGAPQGGVYVEYTGVRNEQTLTVRVTCQHR